MATKKGEPNSTYFKHHLIKKSFDKIIIKSHYESFSSVFVGSKMHGNHQAFLSIFLLSKMLGGP
jgi:hypothetical protein